jgi:hypothetical protein
MLALVEGLQGRSCPLMRSRVPMPAEEAPRVRRAGCEASAAGSRSRCGPAVRRQEPPEGQFPDAVDSIRARAGLGQRPPARKTSPKAIGAPGRSHETDDLAPISSAGKMVRRAQNRLTGVAAVSGHTGGRAVNRPTRVPAGRAAPTRAWSLVCAACGSCLIWHNPQAAANRTQLGGRCRPALCAPAIAGNVPAGTFPAIAAPARLPGRAERAVPALGRDAAARGSQL